MIEYDTNGNMLIESGYSRKEWDGKKAFRDMTFDEFINAGSHIQVIGNKNTVVNVKVNGSVQTWKRTPGKGRMPIKYGMYEYGEIMFFDGKHSSGPCPVVPV